MTPFADERLLFDPVAPDADAVPLIFAFPNDYTIGITSLGYQVVWSTFAMRADVDVCRLFTDISEPLPSESELLGFSVSWELDYVNIFKLLEQLGIPLRSCDRTSDHPLIFGGGPVLTGNPEPFAEFFDIILAGDGEVVLGPFIDAYKEVRDQDRAAKLKRLAKVPGIYVPSLYHVTYRDKEGAIEAITPIDPDIPEIVAKQTYRGNTLSASTVVTEHSAWENIFMVEVVRSCPEMCRFCLASYLTLPFRTASLEESLIPAIAQGLNVTNRIGLLGASVTQHPEFHDLLAYLNQDQYDGVRLSISSVRTNTVTEELARTLSARGTKSLTIAIESGSEKVREIVNKKLTNDEICQATLNAKAGGLKGLKLYGMAGVPGETVEDIEATASLLLDLRKTGPRITFGCSTFVPKAHTPFQWFGVNPEAKKRLKLLQKRLAPKGIEFRPESYNWSIIQALISRGDRRLAPLLELVRDYGDSLGSYKRAFKDLRGKLPPLDYYVHQNWSTEQVLPWQHLQGPLPDETLKKHLVTSGAQQASQA